MKTTEENESKVFRKKIADIINENPDKISNYDWAVISGSFDKDCICDVMKFIEDDSVCAIIENHIIKALRKAINRQEYHRGKTQSQLIHDFESIRQMRALFVDMKDYVNKKKASDSLDNDKAKEQDAKLTTQQNTYDKRIKELEDELKNCRDELKLQFASKYQLEQENKKLIQEIDKLKAQTPETSEQEWISCFDGFLHENLNPQKIAEALKNINHQNFPKNERGYWRALKKSR